MEAARVIEVFSSIQGEGIYVGQPHLFVRFWNCNLACHYCDTDYLGSHEQMSGETLLERVRTQLKGNGFFHAVSLTGGEPLLWWKFLKGWLPKLKVLHPKVYLETNGTLPDALREILPWVDIVAMDVKPPSATADRPVWKAHEVFLQMAKESGREVFVKIVVTPDTRDDEIDRSIDLVAGVDSSIPVVLQPATPWGAVRERISPERLAVWHHAMGKKLRDVRVIPQMHRILGLR